MSLFSTNRCKSLSAEYVEEQSKIQESENEVDKVEVPEEVETPEESGSKDIDTEDFSDEKDFVSEAAYIDALLKALE